MTALLVDERTESWNANFQAASAGFQSRSHELVGRKYIEESEIRATLPLGPTTGHKQVVLNSIRPDSDSALLTSCTSPESFANDFGHVEIELAEASESVQGQRLQPQGPHAFLVDCARSQKALLDTAAASNRSLIVPIKEHLSATREPHGISLHDAWTEFQRAESTCSSLPLTTLVRPSGSFRGTASLGIVCHYPTFRTHNVNNGECADATNQCMRLLLKKGLINTRGDDIDQWDIWHRRETTVGRPRLHTTEHIGAYTPPQVQQLHENMTLDCLNLSRPKVLLLFGAHVQAWVKRQFKQKYLLAIDSVDVLILMGSNGSISAIAVCSPHPENVYFDDSIAKGKLIDAAIDLAVGLAGLHYLPLSRGYFEYKGSQNASVANRVATTWSIGPRDSRVMLIARMKRHENETGLHLDPAEIPFPVKDAYAKKFGIAADDRSLLAGCLDGKSLVATILASYTDASRASRLLRRQRGLPSLREEADQRREALAKEIAATGHAPAPSGDSLPKARAAYVAKTDARRAASGQKVLKRSQEKCPTCGAIFTAKKGLRVHVKTFHERFRLHCPNSGCNFEHAYQRPLNTHMKICSFAPRT